MNDIIAMPKCRHALDTKENEIGEELCFCEIYSLWLGWYQNLIQKEGNANE